MSATPIPDEQVVQVLMPAGLLARLELWLATTGMRLHRAPINDETPTFMVGADLPESGSEPGRPRPLPEILDAYEAAVAYLAEAKHDRTR
ncbi:hypothetical protein ACIHFD_49135 [Nonomuraea sp. NPDC051941]|uniref:hypothetical protein n=1 Tax=Nonomuraea sp. NPDC051941 TaxID=3364373 RepID=UPI0037C7C793